MKFEFYSQDEDGQEVRINFDAVTLPEIEEMYRRFLRGSGFYIKDEDE
jgi:hypothetical protein